MYWNNRVFRRYADINGVPEPFYTMHEVYYNENNEIDGYIEDEKAPWGQDVEELRTVLQWMLEACDRPVIDILELEEYFRNRPPDEPEEYQVFDSVEELLEELDKDRWSDDGGPSGD